MSTGFIKFLRSEAAEELMRYPTSFTLLAQIAVRARREIPKINPFHMEVGEAMIGDYATIGLTRQQFRQALDRLKEAGFVTTRATNKGTIAKLCNTDIYDINTVVQQPANQPPREPASNHQGNQQTNHPGNQPATTNKNVKKENNERSEEGDVAPPPPVVEISSVVQAPDTAPSQVPAAPAAKSTRTMPADEAPIFQRAAFNEYLDQEAVVEVFGRVNKGYYWLAVSRAAEDARPKERTNDGWQKFIFTFLTNDMTATPIKLVLASAAGSGTHKPRRPHMERVG